jgi:hypothetical protein
VRCIPFAASVAIHLIMLIALAVSRMAPVVHVDRVEPQPIVATLLPIDVAPSPPARASASAGGSSATPVATGRAASASLSGAASASQAGAASARARMPAARVANDRSAWAGLAVRIDNAGGDGRGGDGPGRGPGRGIGLGDGGSVKIAQDVPTAPPPPSRARPARLVYPTRDLEVEDDSYLFVARVTVDTDGSVVGARMLKTHPGSRGERAASAIWSFRYSPALDERGVPMRATFEQPFQVR